MAGLPRGPQRRQVTGTAPGWQRCAGTRALAAPSDVRGFPSADRSQPRRVPSHRSVSKGKASLLVSSGQSLRTRNLPSPEHLARDGWEGARAGRAAGGGTRRRRTGGGTLLPLSSGEGNTAGQSGRSPQQLLRLNLGFPHHGNSSYCPSKGVVLASICMRPHNKTRAQAECQIFLLHRLLEPNTCARRRMYKDIHCLVTYHGETGGVLGRK